MNEKKLHNSVLPDGMEVAFAPTFDYVSGEHVEHVVRYGVRSLSPLGVLRPYLWFDDYNDFILTVQHYFETGVDFWVVYETTVRTFFDCQILKWPALE